MTFGEYALALGIYGAVIVLGLWGLYALALTYLYLMDAEWRELIRERLRQERRRLKLWFELAAIRAATWGLRMYKKLGEFWEVGP